MSIIFALLFSYCPLIFLGRKKLARSRVPPTNPCKFCDKQGHSSSHCTAKETGIILVLFNLLKDLLSLPNVPIELLNRLRNKAPPLTIERLAGHYEDIAESSDDELDEVEKIPQASTTNPAEVNHSLTTNYDPLEVPKVLVAPTTPVPTYNSTGEIIDYNNC